jgi:hypothetical protein
MICLAEAKRDFRVEQIKNKPKKAKGTLPSLTPIVLYVWKKSVRETYHRHCYDHECVYMFLFKHPLYKSRELNVQWKGVALPYVHPDAPFPKLRLTNFNKIWYRLLGICSYKKICLANLTLFHIGPTERKIEDIKNFYLYPFYKIQ